MKKKEWIPYGIAIVLLFIGAFYDYQITDALYHRAYGISMLFERFLLIPVQSIVIITMCMIQRKTPCWWTMPIAFIASGYMIQDALHYWVNLDTIWLLVTAVSAVVYTLVIYLIIKRIPTYWLDKQLHFFVFFTKVLITAIFITTILKTVWGRIRYRDIQDVTQFCVWYRPCGLVGNHSFPSGHTTAFTSILCLLQWKQNTYEKPSPLRYGLITLFIIAMPLTRMIMGAHFLSDTAIGFCITYTVYLAYRQYDRKRGYI